MTFFFYEVFISKIYYMRGCVSGACAHTKDQAISKANFASGGNKGKI